MRRRAKVPQPRVEGVPVPGSEGLHGGGLYEAVARSILELGDPDEWDLLPSLGLLYSDGERVGMALELPITAEIWIAMQHPVHVVRWLAETVDADPHHPPFNRDGDLVAVFLVVEAWMSRRPADVADDDAPLPSDDPNRVEQRLCMVVGRDSLAYTSMDRGSTEIVMHHEADGRMVAALRGLLAVMAR